MSTSITFTPAPYICGGCNSLSASEVQLPHTKDTVSSLFNRSLPYGPSSYSTLLHFLQRSHSQISVWGTHRIGIPRHQGTKTYAEVKCLLKTLIKKNKEFTEQERDLGKQCIEELSRLHQEKNNLLPNVSWFTKLIIKIAAIFSCKRGGQIRAPTSKELLDRYTSAQFLNAFGVTPQVHFGEYRILYKHDFGDREWWESASRRGSYDERIQNASEEWRQCMRNQSRII